MGLVLSGGRKLPSSFEGQYASLQGAQAVIVQPLRGQEFDAGSRPSAISSSSFSRSARRSISCRTALPHQLDHVQIALDPAEPPVELCQPPAVLRLDLAQAAEGRGCSPAR